MRRLDTLEFRVCLRARAHLASPNRHIEFYFAFARARVSHFHTHRVIPPVRGCNDYNIRLAVAICESTHNQYRRPNYAHTRERKGERESGRWNCAVDPVVLFGIHHRPQAQLQHRWSIAESSARDGGPVEKCKCIDAFGSNGLPFGRWKFACFMSARRGYAAGRGGFPPLLSLETLHRDISVETSHPWLTSLRGLLHKPCNRTPKPNPSDPHSRRKIRKFISSSCAHLQLIVGTLIVYVAAKRFCIIE